MIKTFALIVRRPDHTRKAFREHYEEIHAPTALPLTHGLARYVRYHLEEELHGTPIFDVITAFWYPSAKEAAATIASIDSPEGEAVRADELTFMDKERNVILPVTPEQRRGGDEGDEPVFYDAGKFTIGESASQTRLTMALRAIPPSKRAEGVIDV